MAFGAIYVAYFMQSSGHTFFSGWAFKSIDAAKNVTLD